MCISAKVSWAGSLTLSMMVVEAQNRKGSSERSIARDDSVLADRAMLVWQEIGSHHSECVLERK